MSEEEKNKIIINNYFYITNENLKDFFKQGQVFPLGSIQKNISNQNSFLNKKRENPDSKIVKQQIDNGNNDINDIDRKSDKDNIPIKKDQNIIIHISNTKNNKSLNNQNYFSIQCNKKHGRKPKSSVIKGYHTKFSHDNILRKIKVYFFKKLIKYINNLIMMKYKDKVKFLKPLISNISQNNKKSFNRELLGKKLKDAFSTYEINRKFKFCDDNYNKIVIKNIYDANITELIDILEMNLLEVFKIFRDSNEKQRLIGLEKLDKVIEELKIKETDDYMNKFIKVAMNFEKYYFIKTDK